ncbi:MAG: chemotaxis protein CheW [Desulfobacteraceae bacterium]|nr:MAG: chemotaxis protein CheW [Desulfobacteraceae bacterium]
MSTVRITETTLYLTFRLGEEVFAIDVKQVREVLDLTRIAKVPRAPEFMRGVINLRGSVVPVVDLKMKFGLPRTELTMNSRIVVMEIDLGGEVTILGAMADSVHEVLELEPSQIQAPPRLGTRWRSEFIRGMGKRGGEFVTIIDIDRVFSSDELALGQEAVLEEMVEERTAVNG